MEIDRKPPETILPPPPKELTDALERAGTTRPALEIVAADHPREAAIWAALAAAPEVTVIERYAFARVGYHRGLDALRAHGWRGAGDVKAEYEGNRGFLSCLRHLGEAAGEIGEADEAERCRLFLRQLGNADS